MRTVFFLLRHWHFIYIRCKLNWIYVPPVDIYSIILFKLIHWILVYEYVPTASSIPHRKLFLYFNITATIQIASETKHTVTSLWSCAYVQFKWWDCYPHASITQKEEFCELFFFTYSHCHLKFFSEDYASAIKLEIPRGELTEVERAQSTIRIYNPIVCHPVVLFCCPFCLSPVYVLGVEKVCLLVVFVPIYNLCDSVLTLSSCNYGGGSGERMTGICKC